MRQVDYDYFEWLIAHIEVGNPRKTYRDLFERLYNTEFVWVIHRDHNRAHDGLDLRVEFFHQHKKEKLFLEGPSLLEVVIGLSRRVSFLAGGTSEWWAWFLLENLGLEKAYDPLTDHKAQRVESILEDLIWRTYERDGTGGFFPLYQAKEDQTKVEIWYQMQAYLIEIREDY
jgi:hypothetical protein